ncbi:Zonular occludens toxin [Pelomonas sp. HMWF004]|nr:Zonular occludens toxin [Pelomonas sp. HMWF004]
MPSASAARSQPSSSGEVPMIIFHEGLPGSGKSYEAMAVRIVPAIKAGREVVAYVEGIDHAKVAELAGVTEERCRELLHVVTREQMADWLAHCRDNAMHVFDEAQNFWGNRARFSAQETQLVTEHRHRGMDLVLMGQDLRDVHATWRRRVELKLCFLKLNAFGTGKRYSVTTYRHLGGDQFSKAGTTITKYDPKYFGTYKSHVSDDTNAEVYTDSRAQVWSNPVLRYFAPLAVAGACWGLWNVWGFFHPEQPAQASAAPTARPQATVKATPPAQPVAASAVVSAPDQRSPIERRMADLSTKGRIRLAGLATMRDHTTGVVEWVQGGTVVMERLTLDALRGLGVAVLISGDLVQLAVGDYRELATPWPLEDMARVSDARQSLIRGPAAVTASQATQPLEPPSFVSRAPDLPGPLTHQGAGLVSRVNRAAN